MDLEDCLREFHGILTKIRFISFVSSAGNGVYTAKATQLPIMVSKMRNSKGFHSTICKHFFRMGFLRPKQKMERGARSGGGLAPANNKMKVKIDYTEEMIKTE